LRAADAAFAGERSAWSGARRRSDCGQRWGIVTADRARGRRQPPAHAQVRLDIIVRSMLELRGGTRNA